MPSGGGRAGPGGGGGGPAAHRAGPRRPGRSRPGRSRPARRQARLRTALRGVAALGRRRRPGRSAAAPWPGGAAPGRARPSRAHRPGRSRRPARLRTARRGAAALGRRRWRRRIGPCRRPGRSVKGAAAKLPLPLSVPPSIFCSFSCLSRSFLSSVLWRGAGGWRWGTGVMLLRSNVTICVQGPLPFRLHCAACKRRRLGRRRQRGYQWGETPPHPYTLHLLSPPPCSPTFAQRICPLNAESTASLV